MKNTLLFTAVLLLAVSAAAQSQTASAPSWAFRERVYTVIPLFTALFVAYFATYALSTRKVISLEAHRKFWNILLLTSLLVSGLLGILLALRINYGWSFTLPFNMLYWHVEAGITMALISVFHIMWHWSYFRDMVKGAG